MKFRSLAFALLCIFLLSCFAAHAKVYLVSVGIADYPGTVNDLRLPADDANLVAWLYSQNTSVEYKLLLNSQATLSNIVNAMQTVFAKAGANDIVVFFFSGHGYPGGFVSYDGYLDYAKVRKAMSMSKSKRKMIFADACFAGKMTTKGRDASSKEKKADVLLFLSSRSNETSIEKKTMKNGVFTTCLTNGLRGAADTNHDRTITAKELYDYVHEKVIKCTSGEQHPVMWGNFPTNMKVMEW